MTEELKSAMLFVGDNVKPTKATAIHHRCFEPSGELKGAEIVNGSQYAAIAASIRPAMRLLYSREVLHKGEPRLEEWTIDVLDDYRQAYSGVALRLAGGTATFFTFTECRHIYRDATVNPAFPRQTCQRCARTRITPTKES